MRNIICYLSPEFIQTRARRGAGPLRKLRECNHPANPVCFHFVQCFVGERVCISKGRVCLMRCRFWMFNIKNFAHLLTLMLRPLPDWRAANQLVLRLNIGGSTFGNEFSKISRIFIINIYICENVPSSKIRISLFSNQWGGNKHIQPRVCAWLAQDIYNGRLTFGQKLGKAGRILWHQDKMEMAKQGCCVSS